MYLLQPKTDAKKMRLNVTGEANLKDIDKFASYLAIELKELPIQQSRKLRLDIDALVNTAKGGCENNQTETESDNTSDTDSSSENDDISSTSEDSIENETMDQDPLSINNMNETQNVNELRTPQQTKYQKSLQVKSTAPSRISKSRETKSANLNIVKDEIDEDLFETKEYDLASNTEEDERVVKGEAGIDDNTSTFSGEIPKPMTVPIEICKSLDLEIVKDEVENDLFETEDNDLGDAVGITRF